MKAAIATATLKEEVGHAVCRQAASCAGIPDVPYVVAVDERHEGGAKTANRAWKEALERYDPQYLVYINDDVEVRQQGWLARMVEALEIKRDFGVAGPSGACATRPQRLGRPGMKSGVFEVKSLAFFLVVIKRAVLDGIGCFDESYVHFACDSDYCRRAQQAGWKCIWVRDVFAIHRRVPVKERPLEVRRWKVHDMALYHNRWGRPKK